LIDTQQACCSKEGKILPMKGSKKAVPNQQQHLLEYTDKLPPKVLLSVNRSQGRKYS
jgi:hypothetical protein